MNSKESAKVQSLSGSEVKVIDGKYSEISYGPNSDGDYAIHIAQTKKERPFPENLSDMHRLSIKYLDHILKLADKREVYPPPADWDYKLITIVCKNLSNKWNFYEDDLEKALKELSKYVDIYLDMVTPKRKRL